jgi:hypothetical protein
MAMTRGFQKEIKEINNNTLQIIRYVYWVGKELKWSVYFVRFIHYYEWMNLNQIHEMNFISIRRSVRANLWGEGEGEKERGFASLHEKLNQINKIQEWINHYFEYDVGII